MEFTITQFLSLDGVTQAPGDPDEDTAGGFDRGGWFVPHVDDEFLETAVEWIGEADAFLLGARTYAAFGQAWPHVEPPDPFAPSMNGLPKHVVTTSALDTGWGPVTVHRDLSTVATLKAVPGRELQVHGSTTLSWSLLQEDLVDRLRLVVVPVVLGAGRRFFPSAGPVSGWDTVSSRVTSTGVVLSVLERSDTVEFGRYPPES